MGAPQLETDRLILREMTPEDRPRLLEILGDAWTMRFYPRPFDRLEVEAWVERWKQSFERNGFGLWGLVLKESGQLVGDTGLSLQSVDEEPLPEVGWHVHRDFQRRGYATEAARASLDFGFDRLGLDRIISLIRPENEPSWCVARKLGMRVWKSADHARMLHRVYLIERNDWFAEAQ